MNYIQTSRVLSLYFLNPDYKVNYIDWNEIQWISCYRGKWWGQLLISQFIIYDLCPPKGSEIMRRLHIDWKVKGLHLATYLLDGFGPILMTRKHGWVVTCRISLSRIDRSIAKWIWNLGGHKTNVARDLRSSVCMSFARDTVMGTGQRDVAIYLFENARQSNVVRPDDITSNRRNKFALALRK